MIVIRFILEFMAVTLIFQYIMFGFALQDKCLKRHQFWLMLIPFGFIILGLIWAFKQQFGKD